MEMVGAAEGAEGRESQSRRRFRGGGALRGMHKENISPKPLAGKNEKD